MISSAQTFPIYSETGVFTDVRCPICGAYLETGYEAYSTLTECPECGEEY